MFSNKELRSMIITLFFEQLLVMLVGIVDTFVVSSCGEAAVSGVSLVNQFNTIFIYLFIVAWPMVFGPKVRCRPRSLRRGPRPPTMSASPGRGPHHTRSRAGSRRSRAGVRSRVRGAWRCSRPIRVGGRGPVRVRPGRS